MSLNYCENCKRETEHKRSGKAIGVLIVTFLLLAGIVGAFGISVLTQLMVGGWMYFAYKFGKNCVQCKNH